MKRREVLQGLAFVGVTAGLAGPFAGAAPSYGAVPAGSSEADETPDVRLSADVVVVGGGAAGLSAAVAAAEEFRRSGRSGSVLLLEKMPELGGDTLIAGGYFNAVDPARQEPLGIDDSPERFERQMLRAAGGEADPALVGILSRESGEALKWLESLGMRFLPEVVEVFGGGFPRAHKPMLPRGRGYVRALTQKALSLGVRIETGVRALKLLTDRPLGEGGRIAGVLARRTGGEGLRVRYGARLGVVLASGGFGADRTTVARYAPRMADFPVDTQPGSTGDMHRAAEAVGAELVGMERIECIPGSRKGFPYPVRLDVIPSRMILVNARGRRFTDETATRFEVAEAVLREEGPVWAVADRETVERYDAASFRKNLYRGLYAGEARRAATPEDLALAIGIGPEAFLATLAREPARSRIRRAPFWAVPVQLRVHATLGGIRIDTEARALDRSGRPIPGLWAAGAVTGGVHGKNRIGGNGINTAVVFGRRAGTAVVRSAPKEGD